MAALSVNTNYGAMVALQQLNKTNMSLEQTQSRINTGLKVAGAKDNGAIFAIAQDMRAALRVLAESGTKESRERAAGALFELDEEARSAKTTAAKTQYRGD